MLIWSTLFATAVSAAQVVLQEQTQDHNTPSLLAQLVSEGVFAASDITQEVRHAWSLLESSSDAKHIRSALEYWIKEAPMSAQKPSESGNNGAGVDKRFSTVSMEGYSLRVSNGGEDGEFATSDIMPFSDPKLLGVDTVNQYTGYFDINESDKHLFYWFFESRNDPINDPVILWLNGGPGCSSMTGLFFELGPASINGTTLTPIDNPYSWNSNANVIFLEQPVGVGYSYAKSKVSTTEQASKDVLAFLQLFFTYFDKFQTNQFHIAGESYAGHYIPGIANAIVENESQNLFNFSSVMIGNGITDPLNQYYQYIPMACNSSESGFKQLISDDECEDLERIYTKCAPLIKSCYRTKSTLTCLPANLYCEKMMNPFEKTGLNYYDIRIPCIGDGCYPQMEPIDKYLNQEYVLNALGSQVDSYVGCDETVFKNFLFTGDEMKPFHQYIAELLELDIPVLIYAGDKDYICNWLGNREWLRKLEWSGNEEFNNAPVDDWFTSKGVHAGTKQISGPLTFLRVFEAGHMVPYDQPENSLEMVNQWVSGQI